MSGKVLSSEAEVNEAVDALLTSLGVPDDGSPEDETGFDTSDAKSPVRDGENLGGAPSADVGALWGAVKPKKK